MVKVVIPIYKTELNKYEKYSLKQCFSILKNYPIVFVKPQTLDLQPLIDQYGSCFTAESFPDEYFKDIKSYNQFMLSKEFYQRFQDVKYILIYQTDAFVFRDELNEWCAKGYDYIGAPWIPKVKYTKKRNRIVWFFRLLCSYFDSYPRPIRRDYKVGNGGLSLRNVQLFYELIDKMPAEISFYKANCDDVAYNEDVFWGVEVNKHGKYLNIPSYKEALRFSMEMYPDASYILNKEQLPFGTHAWYKPPYDAFWRRFIDFDNL